MLRRTYTIKFKTVLDDCNMTYTVNSLYQVLLKYCSENNIDVRKIKIKDIYEKSYIRIKGSKEDFGILYIGFFNRPDVSECVETITPFKV